MFKVLVYNFCCAMNIPMVFFGCQVVKPGLTFDAVPRKGTGNMTLLQVVSRSKSLFQVQNCQDSCAFQTDCPLVFLLRSVQQMIGRAGRPGFDIEGHAIIMTEVMHHDSNFGCLPWPNFWLVNHGQKSEVGLRPDFEKSNNSKPLCMVEPERGTLVP